MDLHFGKRLFVFRILMSRWISIVKNRKTTPQIQDPNQKNEKEKGFDFAF